MQTFTESVRNEAQLCHGSGLRPEPAAWSEMSMEPKQRFLVMVPFFDFMCCSVRKNRIFEKKSGFCNSQIQGRQSTAFDFDRKRNKFL